MAIFRIKDNSLIELQHTTFAQEGLLETKNLRGIIAENISAIDRDFLVLCEEFNQFKGSSRSIDILAVDRSANLVVIELKRTEDGDIWIFKQFDTPLSSLV